MSYKERLVETAEFEPPVNTRVAILDAGGQLTKSIDRNIRNLGVQSDVFPINTPFEVISKIMLLELFPVVLRAYIQKVRQGQTQGFLKMANRFLVYVTACSL
jgi:hypothetical protein